MTIFRSDQIDSLFLAGAGVAFFVAGWFLAWRDLKLGVSKTAFGSFARANEPVRFWLGFGVALLAIPVGVFAAALGAGLISGVH